MVQTWSTWKRFPDAQSGEHVEAPIGPGVYEVRHTMTGRVVAFGHSGNVANALADLQAQRRCRRLRPALPRAAAGVACRRPRISHLRGGQPRRSQDGRAAPDGPAPDRVAPPHGHGLGRAPSPADVLNDLGGGRPWRRPFFRLLVGPSRQPVRRDRIKSVRQ